LKTVILAILALAIIVPVGTAIGYFLVNLPKYDNAIVHGTVVTSYQGADLRPGFSRPPAWYLNISLDKGTNRDLGVWEDCANQTNSCPDSYPVKLNGIWYYRVIVNCDIYKAGDSVFLRIPIYQGGNVWSEPKAVQGYNYNNVSPHTYDYPALYKEAGTWVDGGPTHYVPVEGC
jgi:hypothetical protein